jgi:hypothetical protein
MGLFKRSKPKLLKNHFAKDSDVNTVIRPSCDCFNQYEGYLGQEEENRKPQELDLHTEAQDQSSEAWFLLNELVDAAICDGREEFAPARDMPPSMWAEITELPSKISQLKAVKRFILYGSSLVRIPYEIGEMESLENFTPYTSYRLHWFPYEIRHCKKLKDSTISTRALYGNYKSRPPFPRLPQLNRLYMPDRCSVCQASFVADTSPIQRWISLPIGTDVVPLLVHACSDQCIADLPTPPENYIPHPHQGGLDLNQPATYW